MIKAIIFAAGGVIMTSDKAYEFLARKAGISDSKLIEIRKKYVRPAQRGEMSTEEFLDGFSSELKINKEKLRKLFEEGSKLMTVDTAVLKIADSLQKHGYVTALVANTTEMYRGFSKETEVYKKFSLLIVSYEVGVRKPEEKMYKIALEKVKVDAKECIFIDSRKYHLAPAAKLGMKTILFKNAEQLKADLQKLGVKI